MQSPNFDAAAEQWRQVLGADAVKTKTAELERYRQNTAELKREIVAVLLPTDSHQVQRIVEIANEWKTPLYPISTGRNWGLGSALPVRDGAAIVDLSGMKRIREINTEHGHVVIEPGVTQRQLFEYLRDNNHPFFFDVTGSASYTSIIGNVLERGVGYFSCRVENMLGLEVVLGNGQLVRTGFWHFENVSATHLLKYGVGPYLDGLFTQSNFGIVTAAAFRLLPQPESFMLFWCRLTHEEKFPELIDTLARLSRDGVIPSVVHIADQNRSEASLFPFLFENPAAAEPYRGKLAGPWSAVGSLYGTRSAVCYAKRQIAKALRNVGPVEFLSRGRLKLAENLAKLMPFAPFARKLKLLNKAINPVLDLATGVPTDAALKSVYWPIEPIPQGELNPDQGRSGLLYCLPVVPFVGRQAAGAVEIARSICREHGFACYITLNGMNAHALEGVINIAFDREDDQQTTKAHSCIAKMLSSLRSAGFAPYRVGIQQMESVVAPEDPFWHVVRDLKKSLDPNHIIAPGRYNLV